MPARPENPRTARMPRDRQPVRRRPRAVLSLPSIVEGAVAMLDAEGEGGLTFRGLAAKLGGGVGSIYWYVDSKKQLLDLATDAVLNTVVTKIEQADLGDSPDVTATITRLRAIGLTLFEQLELHPWAARYLLRDSSVQLNSLRFYELTGQQLLPLNLTNLQRFHGVSAIVSYVVGVGAEMSYQGPPLAANGEPISAEDFFAATIQQWLDLDEQEYPFVHSIADVFQSHDDFEQFAAGLDLILAGLQVQATS